MTGFTVGKTHTRVQHCCRNSPTDAGIAWIHVWARVNTGANGVLGLRGMSPELGDECCGAGIVRTKRILSPHFRVRKVKPVELCGQRHTQSSRRQSKLPAKPTRHVSTHLQQPIEGKDFLNELIDKTLTISDEELSQQISEIEINLPVNETNDEITEAILTSELRELSVMPVVRPIDNRNDWNCLETNRIAELLSATKIFDQTLSTNIIRVNTFKDMILNYNTKLEDFIVDIVRFTKSLNGFTRICSDDQWVLLKSGCIDMVLLREAMYYNDNSDSFFMRLTNENSSVVSSPMPLLSDVSTHPNQHFLPEDQDFLDVLIDKTLTISDEELSHQISEIVINLSVNENNNEIQTTPESRRLAIMPIIRPLNNHNDWNCLETNRIAELLSATKIFDQKSPKNITRVNSFKDMVRNCNTKLEAILTDIVRFTKSLNGFTHICSDDQLVLLKSGCIEMLLLREALYYNNNLDSFFMKGHNEDNSVVSSPVSSASDVSTHSEKPFLPEDQDFLNELIDKTLTISDEELSQQILEIDIKLSKLAIMPIIRPLNNRNDWNCLETNRIAELLEQQLYIYLLQRYLLLKYGSELNISDEELTQQILEIEINLSVNEINANEETNEIQSAPELAIIPVIRPLHNPNDWNCLETNRIAELLSATKIFDQNMSQNIETVNDLKDMIRKYNGKRENFFTDIVRFCKNLNGFATICSDDQLSLLKSGCLEMLLLRETMHYDNDFDSLFMKVFTAILLYNPNRPHLKHKHTVKLEQQLYIYLLQRYLLLKYGSECRNFTANVCESCKAFFRRAIRLNKTYAPCPSTGKCTVNKLTRTICRFCRLTKCFEAGMRPEFVRIPQELMITPVMRSLDNHNDWNCLETNRIAELLSATKIFDYELPSNTVSVNHFHEMVPIYSVRFDTLLADIVRFSKNLNGFATICSDDQISLLKSGCIDVVILREAVYYNHEVDMFLMRMLTAIVLFNPNRPHLKHKDNVKLEQQLYIYLLQRYLLLKYGSECKNFAANVCESCKAFFRRAIRLNKEFVRSNNENQIRRQNIELNRLRHYISGDNSVVSSPVFLAADVSTHSHNSIESQDFLSEIIDKTIGISAEEMTQQITEIEINSVQESQELIITPVIRPLDNHNDWNCLETNRIAELLSATKIFDYNLPSNTVSVNHFHEMVRNYNNRFEDFLSDIVRFSKNLNGFATICSDDQLSLLKSGGIDVVLLREAVYYNNEVDTYLLKMEFMTSTEENKMRRQLIAENCLQNNLNGDNSLVSSLVSSTSHVSTHSHHFNECENFLNEIIDKTVNISDEELTQQILEIEINLSVNETNKEIIEVNSAPEPMKPVVIPIIRPLHNPNDWNCLETNRIAELLSATKIFDHNFAENIVTVNDFKDMFHKYHGQLELFINDIVRFTKSLHGFANICTDDQLSLVKNGCHEIFLLREAMHYNNEVDCLCVKMEFVRSNEENKIHKQLIAENREKRKSNAHNSVISSPVSSASDVSTHSQQSIEGKDFLNELIDKTVNISDEELSQQILEIEINLSVNENNCSEETNKVQLTPKVQSLPIIPIIRPLDNRNDWNCLETNRIAELLSATKIFDYELPKNTITANDFSDMIIKYHDQMDRDIKDLVRFTKNLNGFANICSADQLSLVKNKCVEICLLREAIYFDNDVDSLYLKIEFVTSIEENKIRKQMIAENREKHKPNRDNSVVSSPVPTATHVDKEVMQKILDISMNLSANKNNNNKKTNKVNSVPESRELSVIPVVRPLNNPNDWNCLETNRIAELLSATKIFDFQMPDNIVAVNHFRDLARMYHGHIDESIGDIVRFTKNLNGFANICPEDQLSLVKNGCVEVMILREAMYYNNDTDSLSLKMEFVRSNEENKIRKQFIAETRDKHKSNAYNSVVSSPVSTASDVSTHSQQSIESHEIMTETIIISDEEITQKIWEINSNLSVNENNSEVTNETQLTPELQSLPIVPVVRPLNNRNDWNCLETNRIAELLSATKIFDYKLPENMVLVNNFKDMMHKYHGQIEELVCDTVRFTKNLNGFANVCPEDQLSLLKYGCIEIIVLREAMYYNNEVDSLCMKMEFVRSNEENKMRRKMIAENRLKDNLNDAKSVDLSPMSTASDVSTHSDQPYSPKDQNFLNELIDKTVNISDEELTQQILEIDINLSVNEINANERIVKVNIDLKPEETAIIPIIRPLDNRNDWNCLETNRIAELLSATKIFDHKLPENLVAVNNFKEFIYNYHDKLENSIIEVANFTKILNGFANICSEDQLSLVKNSCLEVILLREAMYYNNEVDSHCMKMLLVCPSDGKCIINRQTRSICRKCRLNKCFAVGMRKEFILNNEVNRSKYIRKKQKQKQLNDSDTCVVSTTSEVVSSTSMFTETAVIISPVSAGRPESTQSVVELRDTITLSMDELIRQSLKTSLVYHVINDYQHWNPLEAKRLRELLTASRVLDYGLSANRIHTKCFKVLNQLCEDRTERVITDLIRFAKLIKGFADVCSEDQLALVKYGFIEVNLMQLLMSFNEETESFVFGDCANTRSIVFHLDVFKFTGVNYYDKFTRFLFMMYPLCKTDQIVCNLVYKCKTTGNCVVNTRTRHHCKKCRLEKCFAKGMRKEFIRKFADKERKELEKIPQNKCITHDKHNQYLPSANNSPANELIQYNTSHGNDILDKIIDDNSISDEELSKMLTDIDTYITTDTHDMPQHMPVVPVFKELVDYHGLNQLECTRVGELMTASKNLDYPLSDNIYTLRDFTEFITIASGSHELFIKNFIDFTRSLRSFGNICPEDRLALVKYGYIEMTAIKSITRYDPHSESYLLAVTPNTSMRLYLKHYNYGEIDHVSLIKSFLNRIIPQWNNDTVILNLLLAIVIFNPNRPNLLHKQTVKLEQQLYIYLLQRYLLLKYGSEWESQSSLSILMTTLKDLYLMNRLIMGHKIEEYKENIHNMAQEMTPMKTLLVTTDDTEEDKDIQQPQIYAKNSFDRFGDDLCGLILSYLSLEQRFVCECVSKQFRRTVFECVVDITLHKWFMRKTRTEISVLSATEMLATIARKCPNIRAIDLRGMVHIYWQQIPEVVPIFRDKLRHICCDLDENTDQLIPVLAPLITRIGRVARNQRPALSHCHRLSRLRIGSLPDVFDISGQLLAKNLQSIEFYYYSRDREMLAAFVAANQSLRSVKFNNNGYQTHDGFVEMVEQLSRLQELRDLALNLDLKDDQNSLNDSLRTIGQKCPHLKRLRLSLISTNHKLNGHTIESMVNYRGLKSLDLRLFVAIDDVFLDPLKHCHRLTHLTLKGCVFSVKVPDNCRKHWPRLQCLTIKSNDITREGLRRVSRLPALQTLAFECKRFIGFVSSLVFVGNDFIDNVCEELFSRTPRLKTIEICAETNEAFYWRKSCVNV
ncbi:unnamed protein product [Medioppia subpectinata]|uniref:Uncharacterized protein n=1 Tax=Medioppia subpectinata TaxID=1979941 RepID=A0A7R9KAT5_9ACAR|nr:unnamed protein product [Medioppia subpectinata]CAG2099968.1 unnamed protein product [Medioppia subpectinata]